MMKSNIIRLLNRASDCELLCIYQFVLHLVRSDSEATHIVDPELYALLERSGTVQDLLYIIHRNDDKPQFLSGILTRAIVLERTLCRKEAEQREADHSSQKD